MSILVARGPTLVHITNMTNATQTQIINAVNTLASEVLIPMRKVRALVNAPAAEFDAAMVALMSERKVVAHYNDHPMGVSAELRASWVKHNGLHFHAVGKAR